MIATRSKRLVQGREPFINYVRFKGRTQKDTGGLIHRRKMDSRRVTEERPPSSYVHDLPGCQLVMKQLGNEEKLEGIRKYSRAADSLFQMKKSDGLGGDIISRLTLRAEPVVSDCYVGEVRLAQLRRSSKDTATTPSYSILGRRACTMAEHLQPSHLDDLFAPLFVLFLLAPYACWREVVTVWKQNQAHPN